MIKALEHLLFEERRHDLGLFSAGAPSEGVRSQEKSLQEACMGEPGAPSKTHPQMMNPAEGGNREKQPERNRVMHRDVVRKAKAYLELNLAKGIKKRQEELLEVHRLRKGRLGKM